MTPAEKLARLALAHIEDLPVEQRPDIYKEAAQLLPEGPLRDAARVTASHIQEAINNQLFIEQLLQSPQYAIS